MAYIYKKFTAQDKAVIPFNAHKQYDIGNDDLSTNKVTYFHTNWTKESVDTYSSASSTIYDLPADTNNHVKYNQLDHLFYKNYKTNLGYIFGRSSRTSYTNHYRVLHEKTNILSIPTGLYGHEIKPGSFYLSSSNFQIEDDNKGNLIIKDTDISNYSTDIKENILNIGPIKGFKRYDLNTYDNYQLYNLDGRPVVYRDGDPIINRISSYSSKLNKLDFDDSYHFNPIKYYKVNFSEKSLFNGKFSGIDFDGINSEVKLYHDDKFNFNKGDDFTITLWANISASSTLSSYLISKSTTKTIIPSPNEGKAGLFRPNTSGALQTKDVHSSPAYPFEVFVTGEELFFRRSDGNITTTVSSSFTTGSMQHIACRYKDSELKVYINGLASGTTLSDRSETQTQNDANIYIGNKGGANNKIGNNFLSGSLSQINIYGKGLTDTQILKHYSSSNGSPYIGNIFYQNGFATITHPGYLTALSGSTGVGIINQLRFQGSHLIYENEYQCTVDEYEFNDTTNPSARKIRSKNSPDKADFATGSLFRPYITTIGLYNEDNELLVVGKLGQPVRTSNETDTTFVVRWDT